MPRHERDSRIKNKAYIMGRICRPHCLFFGFVRHRQSPSASSSRDSFLVRRKQYSFFAVDIYYLYFCIRSGCNRNPIYSSSVSTKSTCHRSLYGNHRTYFFYTFSNRISKVFISQRKLFNRIISHKRCIRQLFSIASCCNNTVSNLDILPVWKEFCAQNPHVDLVYRHNHFGSHYQTALYSRYFGRNHSCYSMHFPFAKKVWWNVS